MSVLGGTVTRESDTQLMGRVQADDTAAFEQLYDRHSTLAFRIARAVCHDSGRAEDAVQEAFLGMWRKRMSYRAASGSFKSWAMMIVRHRAIDSTRHEGTRPPVAELDEGKADTASSSVPEQVISRSETEDLRSYLRLLPEAQSEVIVLAFFGQMTHAEIAQRLSLPAGTVKGRMRVGLEKLARQMEADETSMESSGRVQRF
jgi:RNA polymerase sigma-70 factor (ECF subfamily)